MSSEGVTTPEAFKTDDSCLTLIEMILLYRGMMEAAINLWQAASKTIEFKEDKMEELRVLLRETWLYQECFSFIEQGEQDFKIDWQELVRMEAIGLMREPSSLSQGHWHKTLWITLGAAVLTIASVCLAILIRDNQLLIEDQKISEIILIQSIN